ncbi:MAG: SUMF1/EgtB/PvdO family nonheme iron enzyme [Gloeotrichia echinulata DVL01]|jgi:formylglycine-generating enzyme required for sulfatase activity/tRNA A-37 threonylcarbamoyl transferase component Bud32
MKLWTPNQHIKNGRFIIQKVLGGGGFGITYRAIEQRTGKLFVIKTLNHIQQSQADFDERQEKFVNEALVLKGCKHPHIVQVYELIQEDGLWGMVMEHIDGEDLAVYIEQHGQLSEKEALEYIEQIGQALEYVHQQGFLHRDIKPNNILLRRGTKTAVLIDFGLAREFTIGKTASMTNSMTQGYAPIEQYEARGKFGAYTDVYALAATLYNLLTARVPIPANFREYAPLQPPKQFNPQISDRVNDAILKGMALASEDRPQTVREWLELVMPPHVPKFDFEYAKIDKNLKITRYRSQAELFTEDLGNGVILEMVAIPGGSFMMGSPENEGYDYERPQHQVTIQPFYIGKFTITQEQYAAVMGENPSYFQGKKRPMEQVSWNQAVEFCAKLSNKTGKKYQLPSEAQWEYACRAGTTTPFHFGETITTDLANYNGDFTYGSAPKGKSRQETTDVGSFPANAFGLHDMHGNVWEWCDDDWHDNYINAPSDGSSWLIVDDNYNVYRLLRGGSWYLNPDDCRSASRYYIYPDDRYDGIGFRVVCVGAAASILRP